MVISVIISAFVFPFVGRLCDIVHPKVTIPLSFVFRALTCIMFYQVTNPDELLSYVSCILMIIATIAENISVDTIFNKNLPKETRAIMQGVYSFSGQLGILIYSFIAGQLFDKAGPASPFVIVGVLDVLYGLGILIGAGCGLFEKYELLEEYRRLKGEELKFNPPKDEELRSLK